MDHYPKFNLALSGRERNASTGLLTFGLIILTILALIGVAMADETPQVRAFNLRLGTEINTNMQCMTTVFDLQDKITSAQAEVKRLTEKYEQKKNN